MSTSIPSEENPAVPPSDSAGERNDAAPATPADVPATNSSTEPAFKVWKPPVGPASALRNISQEDVEMTAADAQASYQALVRRNEALNNAPLRTKAMRDAEEKTKLARWPHTTIRVKFADRTMLEKVFPSSDRIKAVYVFVRDSLADDVKPIKFVLYQSPPMRELKNSDPKVRDLSLAQLQLAPSSMLFLRFEDDRLNHASVRAPLRPDILAQAVDLPPPPTFSSAPTPTGTGNTLKSSSSTSTGEKKIPKWLKLPGKK